MVTQQFQRIIVKTHIIFMAHMILRKNSCTMLAFGVLLIFASVCNSQPQAQRPPLDLTSESKPKLYDGERVKRETIENESSSSNTSLLSSNSNLSSGTLSATQTQQTIQPSVAAQTGSSSNLQGRGNNSSSITNISSSLSNTGEGSRISDSSNGQLSDSTVSENSGVTANGNTNFVSDNPILNENSTDETVSGGLSNNVNNSDTDGEGSGNDLNNGTEVQVNVTTPVNLNEQNLDNSTSEDSPNDTNATTVTVFDNEVDNDNLTSVQNASKLDVQTQIYIVSGTLGGVILLLILLVLALALSIARIKDQIHDRHQRYIPNDDSASPNRNSRPQETINSYVNTAYSGGHEMEERGIDTRTAAERMGYETYNGRPNPENRKSAAKNPAPIPRARNAGETDSFGNGARSDNDRRYQTPRQQLQQSHGSKHQLRLEEGVSPVHSSHPGANEFGNRDQNIRDRYRDRH